MEHPMLPKSFAKPYPPTYMRYHYSKPLKCGHFILTGICSGTDYISINSIIALHYVDTLLFC